MKTSIKNNLATVLLIAIIPLMLYSCSKKSSDNVTPTNTIPSASTGDFSANGTKYSGSCSSFADIGSGGASGNLDVIVITLNTGNSFQIYNIPAQSSGTYTFTSGLTNLLSGQLYALCTIGTTVSASTAYYSTGGTITKTGAKSFTFSCTMLSSDVNQTALTVTGEGAY